MMWAGLAVWVAVFVLPPLAANWREAGRLAERLADPTPMPGDRI